MLEFRLISTLPLKWCVRGIKLTVSTKLADAFTTLSFIFSCFPLGAAIKIWNAIRRVHSGRRKLVCLEISFHLTIAHDRTLFSTR